MSPTFVDGHWLAFYGNNSFQWQPYHGRDGAKGWVRRIGIVESSFDVDGRDFEGRADVTGLITLEVTSRLSKDLFRQKIILAWAALRAKHALLAARTLISEEVKERYFVVETPRDLEDAIERARQTIVFVEDFYPNVDTEEFRQHCLNGGRLYDPNVHLRKILVLTLKKTHAGNFQLQFMFIAAHEITDGLTNYNWLSSFIRNINTPNTQIRAFITESVNPETIKPLLPLAQEDLYPPIPGNHARQLWFWLLSRVLLATETPLPKPFLNPLRRPTPRTPFAFASKYPDVLDYTRIPPCNSFHCALTLSPSASQRLHRLCKEAKTSVGAGLFALVAMSMMYMYEQNQPDVPLHERKLFIATFPLNPRPFFGYQGEADSCMLAFSNGIVFPFLSRELDLEGRFRLLCKVANRQLRQYQKRTTGNELRSGLIGKTPARVIALTYIQTLERTWLKMGLTGPFRLKAEDVKLPHPTSTATCGVSSVGNLIGKLHAGMHSLDIPPDHEEEDAIRADFRAGLIGVRARDNEFLVGCTGEPRGMQFAVSFDGNVIDEEKVFGVWKPLMEGLLEEDKARL